MFEEQINMGGMDESKFQNYQLFNQKFQIEHPFFFIMTATNNNFNLNFCEDHSNELHHMILLVDRLFYLLIFFN